MNVFILDRDMEKSAAILDDAHLKAQINESCQILTANYNHKLFPNAKIGHVSHPVTIFYRDNACTWELFNYLGFLLNEYLIRFKKYHQSHFWWRGFYEDVYKVQRRNQALHQHEAATEKACMDEPRKAGLVGGMSMENMAILFLSLIVGFFIGAIIRNMKK